MGEFSISAHTLWQLIEAENAPPVFDVRKPEAFAGSDHTLPGARWRDFQNVSAWSKELSADRLVIVYCVHGHEVSQGATAALRSLGYDARYLKDGIEGWLEAGYRTDAKAAGSQ